MTRFYTVLFSISILLLFTQCVDEITLDIDGAVSKVVVDGLIADSLDTYNVRLSYSSVIGVGNDNILEPVTAAQVQVLDNAGNSFDFIEKEAGTYSKEMQGEAGRQYHVEIILADGTRIESVPALLQAAPSIGAVRTEVRDETSINTAGNVDVDRRLVLKMNTDLEALPTRPFLRWRAEGEYEFREWYPMGLTLKVCYIQNNVDLNNLQIFDTRTLDGTNIVDEPFINTALDYRFATQYAFHIKQYAMTEQEFLYWDAVQDITTIDGSLFDTPPGTIRGNLLNKSNPDEIVVGYFSVNGVRSKRFFANPESLNQSYIEPRCRSRFGQDPSQDCLDCTIIQNSSLLKPPYWIP